MESGCAMNIIHECITDRQHCRYYQIRVTDIRKSPLCNMYYVVLFTCNLMYYVVLFTCNLMYYVVLFTCNLMYYVVFFTCNLMYYVVLFTCNLITRKYNYDLIGGVRTTTKALRCNWHLRGGGVFILIFWLNHLNMFKTVLWGALLVATGILPGIFQNLAAKFFKGLIKISLKTFKSKFNSTLIL